jgi:hypothetical protein
MNIYIPRNLRNRTLLICGGNETGWTVCCGKEGSKFNDDDEAITKKFLFDNTYDNLQDGLDALSDYVHYFRENKESA